MDTRILIQSDINNPSRFSVRFYRPLQGRYKVHWIYMPNTLYNIDSYNDGILVGGVPLVLAHGRYDGSTLSTLLKTSLDTLGGAPAPYTVAFNSVTSRLSVTTADASDIVFGVGTANFTIGVPVSGATVLSGVAFPLTVFLYGPNAVGLSIQEASLSGYTKAGGSYEESTEPVVVDGKTTTTRVYVHGTPDATLIVPLKGSDYVFLDSHTFPQTFNISKPTRTLNISVVDIDTGLPLDVNQSRWSMLIEDVSYNWTKDKRMKLN